MKYLLLSLALFAGSADAGMALFQYEVITGQTKQCVYNYLGNTYTITVKSYQMCPLSIKVSLNG